MHHLAAEPQVLNLRKAPPSFLAALTPDRLTRAAVVFGVVCRVAQYLAHVSYWQDESTLMLNVLRHDAGRLPFGPLDAVRLSQAAPPLFLWALKGLVTTFGPDEYAGRLVPLACGVAAMLLFARVARALLPGAAVAWAAWMFAAADGLIFESATVKPYCGDLLAALLLVWAGFVRRRDVRASDRFIVVAIFAALLAWMSYASVFVFVSVAAVLLPAVLREGRRGVVRAVVAGGFAAASIGVVAFFCARAQRNPMLVHFWADRFVPWDVPAAIPLWLVARAWELFLYALPPVGGVLLLPAVVGAAALWRERRDVAALLLAPFAVALLAAAAQAYPLGGGRVTMYLVPFELMLAAAGVVAIARGLSGVARRAWWSAGVGVVAAAAGVAVVRIAAPRANSGSREAVAYLRAHRQPGERVYVLDGASEDLLFYWPTADAQVHLDVEPTRLEGIAPFWVVASYKPQRGHKALDQVLRLPGAVVDDGRTFHTRCADVYFLSQRK